MNAHDSIWARAVTPLCGTPIRVKTTAWPLVTGNRHEQGRRGFLPTLAIAAELPCNDACVALGGNSS